MIAGTNAFDKNGLKKYIEHLDRRANTAVLYDQLLHNEGGKFIVKQFEDRLVALRELYGAIDSASSSASVALAIIQGMEFEVRQWLQLFSSNKDILDWIVEEKERINGVVNKKKPDERRESFLPTGYKKKEK